MCYPVLNAAASIGKKQGIFPDKCKSFWRICLSLPIYLMTHVPVENSEINLFKVSWTPQHFLKETKNPLSCSQEIKTNKQTPQQWVHIEPARMI